MGQYWRSITKKDEKTTVWSLQTKQWREAEAKSNGGWVDGYNGVKLMEHSWIGNSFMDAISKFIHKNPVQVAWVGDYANDYRGDLGDKVVPHELHKIAWGGANQGTDIDIDEVGDFGYEGKFLVNHDKKVAIDFSHYMRMCDTEYGCIHPLSLLTACGNDMGLGDFHEGEGYGDVGVWCMDTISIEDKLPKGVKVKDYRFVESYYCN